MPDLTSPKRRVGGLLLAALIGVALLGTAGCDPGQPAAAKVGDHEITAKQVQDDLKAEAEASKKGGSRPTGLYGTGKADSTYDIEAADSKLSALILDQIIADELARNHVKPNKADTDGALSGLCSNGDTTCLDSYSSAYRKRLLAQQARLNAYIRTEPSSKADTPSTAELTAEAKRQFDEQAASDPTALDLVCFKAGQFPDQATADAAKTQVQGGADIDAVATAAGGAPGNGESCQLSSSLSSRGAPAELTSGKAGDIFTFPESSDVLLIQVTGHRTATFEDLQEQLVEQLKSSVDQQSQSDRSTALRAAVTKLAAKAKVEVDPKYGTYNAREFKVVPPPLPKGVTTTTTAPAVSPSGSSTTGG